MAIESSSNFSNSISFSTAQNGTDFVGVKISQTKREIVFPMGYFLEKQSVCVCEIDKIERKEILNFIKSIDYCANGRKGEKLSILNGKETSDFPVRAMFAIIEDFLDRNSYYTEKETLYVRNASGKISWPRTIKRVRPVVSQTGIAFLDFIVRKNRIQENQLITELHKYCVYKCFEIFGFLYTSQLPEKGMLQENDVAKNRKYYAQFLQNKIDTTNLESSMELFSNMLDFINNFDSESDTTQAAFGTNCYQVVWEKLIDSMLGTISQRQKEKYFYPASSWAFIDGRKKCNAPLRPDTIMIQEKGKKSECFIIDAKYYSYSMLRELKIEDENRTESVVVHGSIPGTDSIQKQITYAEYIDSSIKNKNQSSQNFRFLPNNIYNVFVLPANNGTEKLQYIGSATSDWKDCSKNYYTVHAVTIDTKFLLENSRKDNKEIRLKLQELIKKH